ncbi:MAG: HlyD family efflux transporter periplasmic adaptor subunit [Planctomycetota bacterium]
MSVDAIEARQIPLVRRKDLESVKVQFRGEPYLMVRDPLSLKYYQLDPTQHETLSQLDGSQSFETLRSHLASVFPTLTVRASDVQQLVVDLHQKGLTQSTRLGQGERVRRREWEARKRRWVSTLANPFFIKLPPLRLTKVTSGFGFLLGWMFTRWGVLVASSILLAAWLETALRFQDLRAALPSLESFFGWPNLALLWLMIGVTKFIHEMGHSTACAAVGRRCDGVGAGLLVFSPTLYCDASDSWMCRSKWQRIMVAAGGMYVELVVGALAVFVWSHSHPGYIHSIALNVAAVSTVSTVLFNANPLIRFDGYYILSDWLEVPNLHEKSSRLLCRGVAWCLGIETQAKPQDPKTGIVWFASYAVASFFYRWLMMALIFFGIYTMLKPYRLESLAPVSLLMFIVMSSIGAVKYWKNIRNTATKGRFSRSRLSISVGVAFAALMAIGFLPLPGWTTLPMQVDFDKPANVFSRVGGVLKDICIMEGETVERGQVLAILSDPETESACRELLQEINKLETEIRSLQLLDRHSDLVLKQQALHRTRRKYAETLPLLHSLTIRAPVSGTVVHGLFRTAMHDDLSLASTGWTLDPKNLGSFVPAGTLVACVVDNPDELIAVSYVDQSVREDLAAGQHVSLRLDALPHQNLRGRVLAISPLSLETVPPEVTQRYGGRLASRTNRDGKEQVESRVFRITTSLPDADELLPSFRGRCKVRLSSRSVMSRIGRYVKKTFYFRL